MERYKGILGEENRVQPLISKISRVFYFMKRLLVSVILILVFFCFGTAHLAASGVKKQRIISLTPATTEILFALNLNEEIVGVTTWCNYPPEAANKEKVGSFSQPDIEKILLLKPDIIFAAGLEQASAVERLRQLKLEVYVCDPSSVNELFESITEIGRFVGREKEAVDLVDRIKTKIRNISAKVKHLPKDKKPKVFIEIWHDPLMTIGRNSFVDELIRMAGGINIAHDVFRSYSYFSSEQVIRRNPDCIILAYMGVYETLNRVKTRLGWEGVAAVKNNRIYNDINPDIFLRAGPRLAEGLEEIYNRLHPEKNEPL